MSTAAAQSVSVKLVDQEASPVSNVVIELLVPENQQAQYKDGLDVAIDQIDKEFVPTVSTIVAGNFISFPNSDDILHHVYSFSPINTFNIPLYGKEDSERFRQEFSNSGVVEIGCNIHDWMLAYVYVAETSLTAISDELGDANLENLPIGEYELRIWHPRLRGSMMVEQISLSEGSEMSLDITLELERERRLRRAPSSSKKRYR